jgi:hypothetical protein
MGRAPLTAAHQYGTWRELLARSADGVTAITCLRQKSELGSGHVGKLAQGVAGHLSLTLIIGLWLLGNLI